MAAETPDVDNIARALKQVANYGDKFINNDPTAREKLVASARDLVLAAETPMESFWWAIWAQPTRHVAARVAVDLKIFETAVANGGSPKSSEDFAAVTGASLSLVKRISRACVSMGMLAEQGANLYVPNNFTKCLATKEFSSGIIFCFDLSQPSFAKLPEYLRNTNFQDPEGFSDGPFQYATGNPSAFSWLTEHPTVFDAFHVYIHAIRTQRPSWTDMYPVQERLVEGLRADGDASALVDMGGGTGQTLQDFRKNYSGYGGRLVLQEIPEVVASAKEKGVDADGRIELHAHSFFDPQPIRGARAYFMRSILHDWPDEQCRKILAQVREAMEPGYSKLLINDIVVSEQKTAWQHVAFDLFMMVQTSAHERTETEWRELFGSCGLEIVGIYNKGEGNEGVIEVARSA
ncbi:putative O-methyltransferase [Hypoxylon sp. FL1284]|nr:putative O-methyltransferase [Hypoxylon sp. FL1284]